MKAVIAIFFSGIFLLTTMQHSVYVCLYKLNEKSITEKYCVNKNVKGSCCKGKCYLNKTIASSENENSNNPFSTFNIKLKETEIVCQQMQKTDLPNPVINLPRTGIFSGSLLEGIVPVLFRPPIVLG